MLPSVQIAFTCFKEFLFDAFFVNFHNKWSQSDRPIVFHWPLVIFLWTGTTEASFQSSGIIPDTKYEILNIMVKSLARLAAQFFRTIPCMPSGPAALLGFICLRRKRTSSSWNFRLIKLFVHHSISISISYLPTLFRKLIWKIFIK